MVMFGKPHNVYAGVTAFLAYTYARVGVFGKGKPCVLRDTNDIEWNEIKTYQLGVCSLLVAKHKDDGWIWFQNGMFIDSTPPTTRHICRCLFVRPTEVTQIDKNGAVKSTQLVY